MEANQGQKQRAVANLAEALSRGRWGSFKETLGKGP